MTACRWPESIIIKTPQDTLEQLDIIMSDYRECFIRHNGLVEVLNK